MDKFLNKLSEYHFIQSLVPGMIFTYCSKMFYGVNFLTDKPVYDFKAEEGDSHAQAMMGRSFLFGIDKPRNYEMAVKWLNKSAAQDNGDAFYYLYVCFSHGFGVAEDKGKAMSYLERAVNKNIPNAWIEMGNHYFYGDNSVKADDKEAFILWHKAAQKGHPAGQYKVGLCYKYGIGVEPNESSAKDWLVAKHFLTQ